MLNGCSSLLAHERGVKVLDYWNNLFSLLSSLLVVVFDHWLDNLKR